MRSTLATVFTNENRIYPKQGCLLAPNRARRRSMRKTTNSDGCGGLQSSELFSLAFQVRTNPARGVAQGCKVHRLATTVAVGTTIADRPPHRSVQARLRIRLLPWMSSGKASIRIGMQNAGLRNPPEQERGKTIPSHLCALTATN
jgi:hypothetical protein